MHVRKFPLFDDTPGAAGGGAPAAAPATEPAAAPAAAPAPAAAAAPAVPPGPNDWIPEKFRVMKEDGSMDIEASARKVEEHRSHLEKRLGSGDLPPKTAEEYKINVPEALAATIKAEDLAADPMLKSFMADAHAAGLSQKQMDMVLSQYLERVPAIGGAMAQMDADACTTQLKEVWKTESEYTQNVQQAYNAAKAYGGEDFEAILKDHGNDPRLVKLLASVGKELGEDRSASASASGVSEADAQSLQKTEAYWNPNHPEHAKTVDKVQSFYQKTYGNKARSTGSMSFGTA